MMERESKIGEDVVSMTGKDKKISVDRYLCKGCGICIDMCPRTVFIWSEDLTKRGFKYPIPKNVDNCVGCRLCEIICPDFAISVEKR